MREMVENILSRYGLTVEVTHGGQIRQVKAFFQPVLSSSTRQIATPLGMAPMGKYRYMGPGDQEIAVDDEITVGQTAFLVVRAEEIRNEKGIVYRWAVCKRKGSEDIW